MWLVLSSLLSLPRFWLYLPPALLLQVAETPNDMPLSPANPFLRAGLSPSSSEQFSGFSSSKALCLMTYRELEVLVPPHPGCEEVGQVFES
jgi:hypothetical protein